MAEEDEGDTWACEVSFRDALSVFFGPRILLTSVLCFICVRSLGHYIPDLLPVHFVIANQCCTFDDLDASNAGWAYPDYLPPLPYILAKPTGLESL